MNKLIIGGLVFIAALIGGFFALNSYIYNEKQAPVEADYREVEYVIEGERIKLGGETRYFGNELMTDLDGDGRDDVVFLVTHEPGGSGTFFYVVAALATDVGYVGSDGYFLGDRIAPQTTEVSQNPRHKNVIVVNYAERAPGEPMAAEPSVGKSAYLKIVPETMQWAIVEPDFAGEAETLPPTSGTVTVRGEISCLPKRGTGPQTMECAIGLKGEDKNNYALRNLFEHDPNYEFSQTGLAVEVSGTITYEEMLGPDGNPYDIVGVLTVTAIREL